MNSRSVADTPLRLPSSPTEVPPSQFPLLSAVVPVVGAVVLWAVTGSPFALWFAALGPLLAGAGLLDGRRGARRARRRETRLVGARRDALSEQIGMRHAQERDARWSRHPDVFRHLTRPDEIWRAVPGRDEAVVVGTGSAASTLRLEGGEDDDGSLALREQARTLADAPVTVPVSVGIAVVGPPVVAAAVGRALVLQVCLSSPPGRLRVTGPPQEPWLRRLPHFRSTTGVRVALVPAGDAVPHDVDVPIAIIAQDTPPPPRCAAVITLDSPDSARLDLAEASTPITVEALTLQQAIAVAETVARRAIAAGASVDDVPMSMHELLMVPRTPAAGLGVAFGTSAGRPAVIDLVADGPHAIVIGVTGSGKSELLTSWVLALAAAQSPEAVSFLLVDFKGGRAFDALSELPHVTGVLTDLDDTAALRAIDSLRAELRHRERELAALHARDIDETAGALSRLVIVVDEYAALVSAHPGLHELFGDIAARGRALGMHLILASQRAAGVFRESVMANAPLRLALRVTDPADSRAVLGAPDAAELSGRSDERGICLVRRAADAAAFGVRVSRSTAGDIAGVALQHPHTSPRTSWLPPLPARIELAEAEAFSGGEVEGGLVLGVVDEPELQRQRRLILDPDQPGVIVVGAAASGKSSVLRALAAQADAPLLVPSEPESGWDAIELVEQAPPRTLIVADDLDLLLARLPLDYASVLRERWERVAREARGRGIRVIVSTQRVTGPLSRVVEAIPRRILLAHATRADFVAAGGEGHHFAPFPPGRGRIDGLLLQAPWVAELKDASSMAVGSAVRPWHPTRHPVAFVASPGTHTRAVLAAWAARGVEIVDVAEPDAQLHTGRVVWGTPDAWLARWGLLSAARSHATFVIDVACSAEYRSITGAHELPPFARAHAGRAWLRGAGGVTSRVVLPR